MLASATIYLEYTTCVVLAASQSHRLDQDFFGTMTTARMIYGTAWKKDRTAQLVVAAVLQGFRAIDTGPHSCKREPVDHT